MAARRRARPGLGPRLTHHARRELDDAHEEDDVGIRQDAANLDDGDMWPVSYALLRWSPAVEEKVVALVKAAIS